MNTRHTLRRLAGIALAAASLGAHAQSAWDAVGDFSTAANPNGAWSYRMRAGDGTMSLLPAAASDCRGDVGMVCWNTSADGSGLPTIAYNTTGAPIEGISYVLPLSVLNLHPGMSGERPVLTFTAPATGTYRIAGHFQLVDRTPTGVQVLVSQGTKLLVNKPLVTFGDTVTFSQVRNLKAGATIDFSVDANGDFSFDSTELKAAVLRLK